MPSFRRESGKTKNLAVIANEVKQSSKTKMHFV
ncbi:MAG: hypothetical protein AWT59_1339 [Candidatus Gallionella acididurans]|uniref:Uncharacterized protein n=1 Tax=Candidatus Gallionella acididurans TaxID=1796491 RepID=A0A139BU57_9PROT|nr:MAG: hypothetical protein AWT59_1339 [Candidatus Gallionella acididurans]